MRSLCESAALTSAQLSELWNSLEGYSFQDPEHQVVFESIRFLNRLGGISPERLAVHLNNRGFPDVDLDQYFPGAAANGTKKRNHN